MKVKSFNVIPKLPQKIEGLRDIAMNMWSSWNWPAVQLFIRLDSVLWEQCHQNLVMMLGKLPQETLEQAAKDPSFVASLERVAESLQGYVEAGTWFSQGYADRLDSRIAYFSMEYGLDVGLPIYSGGLGVLSGDHLKSASDLGLPLVGVGLLYQHGYFQQYLNLDGWQGERYPLNDWYNMPVIRERDSEGNPLKVSIDLSGETLTAQIWKVLVGRVPLYLLDANIPDNPPHLRKVTAELYGGDRDNRIRQEILLGVGGIRALGALGIKPSVFHINEGHSAFLLIERISNLVKQHGISFVEARELVWATSVFTTHTPIPAGNEVFEPSLVKRYFGRGVEELGLSWEQFLELGQEEPGRSEMFSMTVFALKLCAHCNGVSKLHGEVSRGMWKKLWHGLPVHEIPIGCVTNGVHVHSWLSHDLKGLLLNYIGPQFFEEPYREGLWDRIDAVPDGELWRIRQIRKERLISFARKRLHMQLIERGASSADVKAGQVILDSEALTIGFARRFADYKRADLILTDPDRLRKILTDTRRPVQIIIAGKAHPANQRGKEIIRKLVHFASEPSVRNRMVFLEDYDMNIARYLVQGVDVWLSASRRPLEASGTSGMKSAVNGALNIGTLDGWWDEAYNPGVGWAIGSGETYTDAAEQDRVESEALYHLLENEVIPLFYERDRSNLPAEWVAMMKRSMRELGGRFSSYRMLMEYFDKYYLPAADACSEYRESGLHYAREAAGWRAKVAECWHGVSVMSENAVGNGEILSGERLTVRVRARLNGLSPDDVLVEAYYGAIGSGGGILDGKTMPLDHACDDQDETLFRGEIPCVTGGRHGFAVRIRPHNPKLPHDLMPMRLKWE